MPAIVLFELLQPTDRTHARVVSVVGAMRCAEVRTGFVDDPVVVSSVVLMTPLSKNRLIGGLMA